MLMAAIEPGRICIKKKGGDAGAEVTVVKVEGNFAIVKDKKGKEGRVSILHLEPTPRKA